MDNETFMQKLKSAPVAMIIFIIVLFLFSSLLIFTKPSGKNSQNNGKPAPSPSTLNVPLKLEKFTSETDFKLYLQKAQNSVAYGGTGMVNFSQGRAVAPLSVPAGDIAVRKSVSPEGVTVDRSSETNVQVLGIDEPDILKNNGRNIFYSSSQNYRIMPMVKRVIGRPEIYPNPAPEVQTSIIKAFPVNELSKTGTIPKNGNLLLKDNKLIITDYKGLYGYDISDPKNPKENWKMEYNENNQLVQARLFDNKIYLVTSNYLNRGNPCPLKPLSFNNSQLVIPCTEIYHPEGYGFNTDTTYTAMIVDPQNGTVSQKISFVGSIASSVLYMSSGALYIAYSYQTDYLDFIYGFISTKASDLFPAEVKSKIDRLKDYDISSQAKMVEYQNILQSYQNTLGENERLKMETEMNNRLNDYYKDHKRELEKTGIVKIGLSNFNIEANGLVSGHPLNQFSLDEYNNHLRIAVTVQGAAFNSAGSANDVYILDSNLRETGKVTDLGQDERIYSVRFLGDKGYVVTFKQVDPFYVLDLKNPGSPKLSGQLKIPGYSSYLHPLDDNHILGIGKEGQDLKISLFNVSDPQNPAETDKYNLSDYTSDILQNHHAFLLDSKHEVFFLPGTQGGYVISYKDMKLSLAAAIADYQIERSLFINDYLYVVGQNKITVFDENNWKEVNHLDLNP